MYLLNISANKSLIINSRIRIFIEFISKFNASIFYTTPYFLKKTKMSIDIYLDKTKLLLACIYMKFLKNIRILFCI